MKTLLSHDIGFTNDSGSAAQRLRPTGLFSRVIGVLPASVLVSVAIIMVAIAFATPLEFPWSANSVTVEDHIASFGKGSAMREIGVLALALISPLLLWRSAPIRLQRRNMLRSAIILSIAMSTISALWADEPMLVCKRLVVLLVVWLTCVALAAALSYFQLLILSTMGCSAFVMLGVFTDISTKRFSPFDTDYRLAGVMHPNDMGMYCAVLLLSLFCLAKAGRYRKTLFGASVITALCLVLTGSRTSLLSVAAAVIVFLAFTASRRAKSFMLLGGIVTVLALAIFRPHVNSGSMTALIYSGGRSDNTFVVRVDIWREALDYVQRRPLVGYGYGGFWTPRNLGRITDDQAWNFQSAHSEYIETALQYGYSGPLLYVLILGSGLVYSTRTYRRSGDIGRLWAVVIIVWLGCTSLTESMGLAGTPRLPVLICYSLLTKLAFEGVSVGFGPILPFNSTASN